MVSNIFFSPEPWGNDPILRQYCPKGLVQPTSEYINHILEAALASLFDPFCQMEKPFMKLEKLFLKPGETIHKIGATIFKILENISTQTGDTSFKTLNKYSRSLEALWVSPEETIAKSSQKPFDTISETPQELFRSSKFRCPEKNYSKHSGTESGVALSFSIWYHYSCPDYYFLTPPLVS